MTEPIRCPVCDQPVPLGFGRPKVYCTTDCRREMARLRRDLADKEADLADAIQKAADGYPPARDFWEGWARMHERQLAELRGRIPQEAQQ